MAAIRFISLCVAFLGVASAFMIPSAGFGLRAALPSANSRRAVSSRISMQALDELKLFVGGLPWAMEAEDLKQAFSGFGNVQDANIVYDRETGRSRGFGFVTFSEKAHAEAACTQMNQAEIGGRTVNVNFAKQRAPREPGSFNRAPRSD